MKKIIIILVLALLAIGCGQQQKKQEVNNTTQQSTGVYTCDDDEQSDEVEEDELFLDVTGWQVSGNKKVFCLVEYIDDEYFIVETSKLTIYKDKVLFDWLDMEPFNFRIKEITYIGDTIIQFQLDKRTYASAYENILEWKDLTDGFWDKDREFGIFIKNTSSLIWDIYYSDEHFKFQIIDSLDISRSGLPIWDLDDEDW